MRSHPESPVDSHQASPKQRLFGLPTILFFIGVFGFVAVFVSAQSVRGQIKSLRQPQVDGRLIEAENLLAQGHADEAKKKIDEVLHADPSNIRAYNLLGILYGNEKDYIRAQDAFEHALKIDPNSAVTHNNLGSLYVAQGKPALAEMEFRRVLRVDPGNRDANYNVALLLMAKGSPASAVVHLQRVRPATLETRLNLIRAYLQAGNAAEGLRLANLLSAEKTEDVRLHFTLGTLLAAQKQYRAAQIELEKADALQPQTFDILYKLGETYLRAGESDKAEIALNRALKLKADSADTLYLQGQLYWNQQRPVDALAALARAHKLAPESTDIILLLARTSMSQNYFDDAIPLLESGVKLAPQRSDLRAALGESYFLSSKVGKALDEFKNLVASDPSARSYALLGLSYRNLGRFDEARRAFQEGVKKDARNASCLFNLGYIEERQGSYARAEELFHQALAASPGYADAWLELANLRIADKKFAEAADLLRKYIKLSRDPASGYYKLAMVERSLHQTQAANRDLLEFQALSKGAAEPNPYRHLFEYLADRSTLSPNARAQQDLSELTHQLQQDPDQPENLYLLAKTELNLAQADQARKTIEQLDKLSANDFRMQTAIGALLAQHGLYDQAIEHFQAALRLNSESDDAKFDLAEAYFRKNDYADALQAAQQVSAAGQGDDTFLALLGDIHAHLGNGAQALEIFGDAIKRNPDNDQYYLSASLVQIRDNGLDAAEKTLRKGLVRLPASGKILWGLGLISVMQGNNLEAAKDFERAVDLLPEWSGSYATLGVFYYQTGQVEKAREVLSRFKGSSAGGLDVNRIEEALDRTPAAAAPAINEPMPLVARQQLLQLALQLADRTL